MHTHLKSATPKNPHRKPPALDKYEARCKLTDWKSRLSRKRPRETASRPARGRAAPKARPDPVSGQVAHPWKATGHAVRRRKTIQILEGRQKNRRLKTGAERNTKKQINPKMNENATRRKRRKGNSENRKRY